MTMDRPNHSVQDGGQSASKRTGACDVWAVARERSNLIMEKTATKAQPQPQERDGAPKLALRLKIKTHMVAGCVKCQDKKPGGA